MILPDCLAFVMRVADSFDIHSENSLALKICMPEIVGFLLLLKDDAFCLGLVIHLVFLVKSKGFELKALATEGTKTGFSIVMLSKLKLLDLSKLFVGLCVLGKMRESISLFVSPTHLKSIPAFPVWIQSPRHMSCNLMGNSEIEIINVSSPPIFNFHLPESFTVRDCMLACLLRAPGRYFVIIMITLSCK